MAEWPKAAVLKTVNRKVRGFESYPLRQESHFEKSRLVAEAQRAEATSYDFSESTNWRCFLDEVRTFFEQNPDYRHYFDYSIILL